MVLSTYLTKELREKLTPKAISMAKKGMSNKQIAFELIISKEKVADLFKVAGYKRSEDERDLLAKDHRDRLAPFVVAMANEGLTNKQIAHELIISRANVIKILKEAGYEKRNVSMADRALLDQERITTVAEKVGVDIETLKRVLNEEGLCIRKVKRRSGPRRHGPRI